MGAVTVMRPSTLNYYFREAMLGVRRSTSLMSLGTIWAALLFLGMFTLVFINLDHLSHGLESKVEIRAFLAGNLDNDALQGVKSRLATIPGVKEVRFVPKEEGLKRLRAQLQDKRFLLDVIQDNPLPDAMDIKITDPRKVASIAARIAKVQGVEEVNYGQGFVQTLFTATRIVLVLAIAFLAIAASLVVFIVGNSIRLSIFSRRREIEIMKLVGATDWFVRFPFLLEGTLIGVIGAALACVTLYPLYGWCLSYVSNEVPFLPLVADRFIIGGTCLGILLAGALMGATASWVFTKKHLHV